MNKKNISEPVGLLNSQHYQDYFELTRYTPQVKLQNIVEHYWFVQWDLPQGQSYQQSVIPHPNTHLTFLHNQSHIRGICKQKYTHCLTEKGSVVGIKFTPAGFYPFANKASITLDGLCNKTIGIQEVFAVNTQQVEQQLLSFATDQQKIDYIDDVLFSESFAEDSNIHMLNTIVADIACDKSMMKVAHIIEKYQLQPRTLQRLFSQYIGVSAKWIINRYRIHDGLTAIDNHENIDWTGLALELGYYDQAHFISDFKKLIGQTPKMYQSSTSISPSG